MRPAACLLALVTLAACTDRPPHPSPPPTTLRPGNGWNVVLITIDTLRADHLGAYGYKRSSSPRLDAFAREGTVFDQAYTFWPKTRPSMVMMLTGRRPSQNGYSHQRMVLLDFNPTLASTLEAAGYATAAIVDNANVAKALGFAKGFASYREIWKDKAIDNEWEGTRAITEGGIRFVREAPKDRPFFLWLHYVNPHAPYAPPAPFDAAFLGPEVGTEPKLRVMPGFHGGIPRPLYVSGHRQLGYYVAQYDGEIAAVDSQIGAFLEALRTSASWGSTVVVVTSDHGESLGEHDYYFDHGRDLFDPCLRIPLMAVVPGGRAGIRSGALASTLDIVPTILDAVKVPYPPDLAGTSLLGALTGGAGPKRARLFAQNDHDMTAALDARHKLVVTFSEKGNRYALFDRSSDPGEARDVSRERPEEVRVWRRELDLFLDTATREEAGTKRLIGETPPSTMTQVDCEGLNALGYADAQCPP